MDFLNTFPELETIEYRGVIGLGSAVEVIHQTAEDENIDLIVMGSTGANRGEIFCRHEQRKGQPESALSDLVGSR